MEWKSCMGKIKAYIIDIIYIIIGCTIMGTGTSLFLLPNKLSTGGVSGIANNRILFI